MSVSIDIGQRRLPRVHSRASGATRHLRERREAADLPTTPFEELREEGWRISRIGSGALRVVCPPHVTRAVLGSFVADFDRLERSTDAPVVGRT